MIIRFHCPTMIIKYFLIGFLLCYRTPERLIEGVILDAENGEPVPYVTVRLSDESFYTIGDLNGEFKLTIPNNNNNPILIFSSLGYETTSIVVYDNHYLTVELNKSITELDEVIINALSPRQIVEQAIRRITTDSFREDIRFNGSFNFLANIDAKVTKESDSIINIDENKYCLSSSLPTVSEIYYQSEVSMEKYFLYMMNFDHVLYPRGFLTTNNLSSWQFDLLDIIQTDGEYIYVIKATFLANEQIMKHEAILCIKDSNYSITEIDFNYFWYKEHFIQLTDNILSADISWKGSYKYNSSYGKYDIDSFMLSKKTKLLNDTIPGEVEIMGTFKRF